MKFLNNIHYSFSPTNLHRTTWQDGGPDAGVDSGMSSEYEEDFAISTETDREKARLEQEVTARKKAREKRNRLTRKELYRMVGSDKNEDIKDFCNFIDELYEKDLGKPIKHKEEGEEVSLNRIKETLTQVAEIAAEVADMDKVIDLKKKSVSYEIIIHSELSDKEVGKIDGILFTFEDGKSEFCNLDYTNVQNINIFKPIFIGLRDMANRKAKLTKKQKEEKERRNRRENKLARITDAKKLASDDIGETKKNIYNLLTSEEYVHALPLDIVDMLSSPLSQIAQLQSELEVDDDGNYIQYDGYDDTMSYEKEQAINIIDNYIEDTDLTPEEEDAIYEDLDRIEDLFEIG